MSMQSDRANIRSIGRGTESRTSSIAWVGRVQRRSTENPLSNTETDRDTPGLETGS